MSVAPSRGVPAIVGNFVFESVVVLMTIVACDVDLLPRWSVAVTETA